MLELREYQKKMISDARSEMQKGYHSICLTAPTGAGKTALAVHMLHTAANKGMTSWFTCHRREILGQTIKAFSVEGLRHGIIASGFEETKHHKVQIASIQTLMRRHQRFTAPSLIVVDECHHIAADSWARLFKSYPKSYFIGLSATPQRTDQKGLGEFFSSLVVGPSVQTLTQQGYLSPYKLYAPSNVDLSGIHTRMGDYEKRELNQRMDRPSITGNAIEHYRRLCYGKRAVVFAVSIQHSKNIVAQFNASGINAAHVDGETPEDERDRAIERFKEGNIQVLSNVEIFSEGFDVPSIEALIILRPTQSLGFYLQMCGRALRPFAGKNQAIILDHVGNWSRHGLPDDDRTWSLEGRPTGSRAKGELGVSVKVCPKCFAAMPSGLPACKYCGEVFPIKPRKIEEKEGELEEIRAEVARKIVRRQQGMAQSMEELYRIGCARGYKNPRAWAYFVFKGRQAKRNRG